LADLCHKIKNCDKFKNKLLRPLIMQTKKIKGEGKMSSNLNDEFENEEEGGPAGETFEEMLRRLAASGNLHIRHVDGDGDEV